MMRLSNASFALIMRLPVLLFALLAFSVGCNHAKPPASESYREYTLQTTAYCPCGKCCNWRWNFWGRPVIASGPSKGKKKKVGLTASGTRAKKGTIAADTNIFPFGTVMYVPGYGYGRVEDRGGAISGHHIDLYYGTHKEALQWGNKKEKVKVWLPKS